MAGIYPDARIEKNISWFLKELSQHLQIKCRINKGIFNISGYYGRSLVVRARTNGESLQMSFATNVGTQEFVENIWKETPGEVIETSDLSDFE